MPTRTRGSISGHPLGVHRGYRPGSPNAREYRNAFECCFQEGLFKSEDGKGDPVWFVQVAMHSEGGKLAASGVPTIDKDPYSTEFLIDPFHEEPREAGPWSG
jgi:hypothetical protein